MAPQQLRFPGTETPRGPSTFRSPQPAFQQPELSFPPHLPSSPFAAKGIGRYVRKHPISNGLQFNKPAVKQAATNVADWHARSQYFRRAGMGAAIRYTLGLEQVPSHVQDYINSRQRRQTGLNPGDINAMLHHEGGEGGG